MGLTLTLFQLQYQYQNLQNHKDGLAQLWVMKLRRLMLTKLRLSKNHTLALPSVSAVSALIPDLGLTMLIYPMQQHPHWKNLQFPNSSKDPLGTMTLASINCPSNCNTQLLSTRTPTMCGWKIATMKRISSNSEDRCSWIEGHATSNLTILNHPNHFFHGLDSLVRSLTHALAILFISFATLIPLI